MNVIPTQLEAIIELLIAKYPNQLPTDNIELNNLYRMVGRQDVIRFLIGHLEVMEDTNAHKNAK